MKLTSAKKLPMPPLIQGRGGTRVIRYARYQIRSQLPSVEISHGRRGCPYFPLSRVANVLARDCARREELEENTRSTNPNSFIQTDVGGFHIGHPQNLGFFYPSCPQICRIS